MQIFNILTTEAGLTLTEKFFELIGGVGIWIATAIGTMGIFGFIFAIVKIVAWLKKIFDKQDDSTGIFATLVDKVGALAANVESIGGGQNELKKLMLGIIAMSSYDPLKKEHLMNLIANDKLTPVEIAEILKVQLPKEDTRTQEVNDILNTLNI